MVKNVSERNRVVIFKANSANTAILEAEQEGMCTMILRDK